MNYQTIISAENLLTYLNKSDWVIFDCRFSLADPGAGEKLYREGHIPQAIYFHLDHDLSSPITQTSGRHPLPDFRHLAKKLGESGASSHSQIVVYDDANGAFAGRLWWLLRCMGHKEVAVLDGSVNRWRKLNHPLTTEIPKITPSEFHFDLNEDEWLSADQVRHKLELKEIKLIDARTLERYRGELEPIDPIAGHVPGAINRPFQSNLNDQGLFLPPEQLRQDFIQLCGTTPTENVIHMCGSGVTACHNLLAMEIAGLTGSKLYAGSWSEWIKDPKRPIAKASE